MIKRNAAKPVRVVPPMMEEQEVSTSTLQELLEKRGNRLKSHIQQRKRRGNQQVLQEFQELHFPESDIQRM